MINIRTAGTADLPLVKALMGRATAELQSSWLDPDQVIASATMMGLDTQIVDDGTYLIAEVDGVVAGCGGWSRRATSYGGDHSAGRDARMLDPATEPTRIRAMYTDPPFVRQGIGGAILAACEDKARDAGFASATLVATLAGLPLYLARGYAEVERFEDSNGGVPVPLVRMHKLLK